MNIRRIINEEDSPEWPEDLPLRTLILALRTTNLSQTIHHYSVQQTTASINLPTMRRQDADVWRRATAEEMSVFLAEKLKV